MNTTSEPSTADLTVRIEALEQLVDALTDAMGGMAQTMCAFAPPERRADVPRLWALMGQQAERSGNLPLAGLLSQMQLAAESTPGVG